MISENRRQEALEAKALQGELTSKCAKYRAAEKHTGLWCECRTKGSKITHSIRCDTASHFKYLELKSASWNVSSA